MRCNSEEITWDSVDSRILERIRAQGIITCVSQSLITNDGLGP